jgi:hypothetical protein
MKRRSFFKFLAVGASIAVCNLKEKAVEVCKNQSITSGSYRIGLGTNWANIAEFEADIGNLTNNLTVKL